jgi:hypothetical protein
MNTAMLAELMNSEKKIELSEKLLKDKPELHDQIFASGFNRRATIQENGKIDFGRTLRETPEDGKKPKRVDLKEGLINNRGPMFDEDEVYNCDPIPLCEYRAMSFDPKIKLTVKLICGFISRLQYDIETTDPKKKALVDFAIQKVYSTLVRDMAEIAMQNGWQFAEKVWEEKTLKLYDDITGEVSFQGRAIIPKKIKTLDPENCFYFYIDTKTDDLVRVEQNQRGKIVAVPRKKIFWFALDKKFSNIFGTSRFRSAYQSWFYANGLEQALLTKLDTTGEPVLVVRFPPGQNFINGKPVPNDVIAAGIIEKVQTEKHIAMPSEKDQGGENLWDIGFVELKNSDNDAYLKAIEYFDKKKVESLGMFGNIIAGEANFSEIDAKEDLTLVLIEDMVDQIEACIQEELVDWIVSYNFGPKHISDVKIKIDRNSLGRSKMLLELLKEMMRIAASEKTGRPKEMPSVGRIARQLNVPTELYSDQIDRGMLDKQMAAEKKMQPKPAAPAANLAKQKQQDEDSNEKNRKTPDKRERERPSSEERLK